MPKNKKDETSSSDSEAEQQVSRLKNIYLILYLHYSIFTEIIQEGETRHKEKERFRL